MMLKFLLLACLANSFLLFIAWAIFLFKKNPGIIDAFWPLTITLASIILCCHHAWNYNNALFQILLIMWCLRLCGHLLLTRIIPNHIEQRYQNISRDWKISKELGFLLNFQLQGFLAVIISIPFFFIGKIAHFSPIHIMAAIVIFCGLMGESIADHQLHRFKKSHDKKVCDVGLWKYSRHPNYFFDWMTWLGFSFAAITESWAMVGFISPLLLLFLMLKITGPITEKNSLQSRGTPYADYQQKTSMFIPLLPKK